MCFCFRTSLWRFLFAWQLIDGLKFLLFSADTQFGIGVKYYSLNEEEMIEDLDDLVETSYYHSIISSGSDELEKVREELDIATSSSKYYQGLHFVYKNVT